MKTLKNLLETNKWFIAILISLGVIYKLLGTQLGFNNETLFSSLVALGFVGFIGTISEDEYYCSDMTFPKILLFIVELVFVIFALFGVFSNLTINF